MVETLQHAPDPVRDGPPLSKTYTQFNSALYNTQIVAFVKCCSVLAYIMMAAGKL